MFQVRSHLSTADTSNTSLIELTSILFSNDGSCVTVGFLFSTLYAGCCSDWTHTRTLRDSCPSVSPVSWLLRAGVEAAVCIRTEVLTSPPRVQTSDRWRAKRFNAAQFYSCIDLKTPDPFTTEYVPFSSPDPVDWQPIITSEVSFSSHIQLTPSMFTPPPSDRWKHNTYLHIPVHIWSHDTDMTTPAAVNVFPGMRRRKGATVNRTCVGCLICSEKKRRLISLN